MRENYRLGLSGLFLIIFLVFASSSNAQYRHALGLRAGETSGITYKNDRGNTAIEAILGFWNDGISITGVYHIQKQISGDVFYWYYGVGGHVAFWDRYSRGPWWRDRDEEYRGQVGVGIDAALGIEVIIPELPFAVSLDVKPFIEFNTSGGTYFSPDPGLGLKFVF